MPSPAANPANHNSRDDVAAMSALASARYTETGTSACWFEAKVGKQGIATRASPPRIPQRVPSQADSLETTMASARIPNSAATIPGTSGISPALEKPCATTPGRSHG